MRRPQAPLSAAVFVRRVIDTLGLPDNPRQPARKPEYRGAGALADLLGVDRVTVTRWLDGERTPEYVPTMQMLQLCGWLTMGAQKPLRGVALDPESPIADALAEIATNQAAAMNSLAGLRDALGLPEQELEPPEAVPKKTRR